MYCLRLFIVVYYNVYHDYCDIFIEKHVYTKLGHCVSELHGHLRPYRNVWPEAVYTKTTLFTELFTYQS